MEPTRVGLIGCGGMGRSLGRQLITLDSTRLVGVADVASEAADRASEELGAPAYTDVDAFLSGVKLDAVIIATPGFQHRPLAEAAAARGLQIFVEKPMAPTVADCDAMSRAAEAAGVTLMVGQVLRYYPCWWQILELVRSGAIGDPWGVTITRMGGGWDGWPHAWRNSLAMSGGLLMAVNAHEIDFMTQVAGEVTEVYAVANHFNDDGCDYPSLYFVSLKFASGAVGLLHSSTVATVPDLSGKVQGSEGTIVYTDGFGAGEIRWARRQDEVQTIRVADIRVENPLRKELRLFFEAIRGTGSVPIPPDEGRRNVAVAEAAYESARTGQVIRLS